jgi:secondary thiamine-phosphate synthase enzyme
MNQFQTVTNELVVNFQTGIDIKDITEPLAKILKESGIRTGFVNIFIPGSTGSVTTIEYEPGVISDLKRALNTLASPEMEYEHEKAWHDGNGHSHVQAALLGPSLTVPIRNSAPALGTWQQVVAVNHDNRARKREVLLTLQGIS